MNLAYLNIDKSWTLFLDRDGVINRRIIDGYVLTTNDFEFLPDVPQSLSILSKIFGRILIVSNQQGIGKGLMTKHDLIEIHEKMLTEIVKVGGKIDKIYYCPEIKEKAGINRKPGIGMGLQAKKDFPEIQFGKAVMVGDSLSDMQFGKRLKMKTVLISDSPMIAREYPEMVDFWFTSLMEMAKEIHGIYER